MRKTLPALLLALAFCLNACSLQPSDWKLSTDGLPAEEIDGETWYDLGGDLLARRADPADEDSRVLVIIGESHNLPEQIDFEPESTKILSTVSDKIFLKLLDRGEFPMPRPDHGTYVRAGERHFRVYRTRSNRAAKVEIDLDDGLAEVTVAP